MAPPAEEAFFKQVAQWANGGWRMPMPSDKRSGSDVAVDTYLVDTSNLWNAFGGLTEAEASDPLRRDGHSIRIRARSGS